MRLGYRPALDGIRGLAIIPVVALHSFGWPREGSLGVDLFFVLSGFLITTLLIEEHAETGIVRLGAFYRRRAARLGPALLLLIAVYTVATRFADLASVAYAATYTTNVAAIVGHVPYALEHLWSLAQEEQFYVLWPPLLAMLLARRPSAIRHVLLALIVIVLIERLVLAATGSGYERLYLGPDAHADPLLVGCLFALWYQSHGAIQRPALGFVALIGVVVGILTLDRIWPILFVTPLRTLYAAVCGLMILAAVSTGAVSKLLQLRPLVFVGRISYSLYLWHVPIQAATHSTFTAPPARAALGLPLVLAAATASYYIVERPLRARLGRRRVRNVRAPRRQPQLGGSRIEQTFAET